MSLPRSLPGAALAATIALLPATVPAQTALPSGDDVDGSISAPFEVDTYTVTVNAGDHVLLSVGELLDDNGNFGPWMRVFEPGADLGGTPAFSGRGIQSGLDAADVVFVAPAAGTYTILISDINTSSVGDDTGNYRIHALVIPGPFLVTDDGGALVNGEHHDGTIHVGDMDPWSVTANAGERIVVNIAELSDGTGNFAPWIRLYGPDGALLDSGRATAGGFDAIDVDWVAPSTGTYVVVVADIDSLEIGPDTGTYRLEGAVIPGPFHVADDGGVLVGDVATSAVTTLGDLDLWCFNANADDELTVTVTELIDDTGSFKPWIRLYDPSGTQIITVSDDTEAVATVTAPTTGSYTVAVADFTTPSLGQDTGTYSILVEGTTAPAKVPRLRIERGEGDTVIVWWLLPADGWVLAQNDLLTLPGWLGAPAPTRNGARMELEFVPPVPVRAFRLERP
jgi:hypothetical protein